MVSLSIYIYYWFSKERFVQEAQPACGEPDTWTMEGRNGKGLNAVHQPPLHIQVPDRIAYDYRSYTTRARAHYKREEKDIHRNPKHNCQMGREQKETRMKSRGNPRLGMSQPLLSEGQSAQVRSEVYAGMVVRPNAARMLQGG